MKKIIVNGTFDVLHPAHIELLNYAKSLGDFLLVCIDTDDRVKQLKGESRPIYNQGDRRYMLNSLKSVDLVFYFDSDEDLIEIIKEYEPDIMVKGSDWKGKEIVASEYCKEIIYYDRIEQYSSTKTIQSIANR